VRKEEFAIKFARRAHNIREINEHRPGISRVDYGPLTPCTSHCGKCTTENIGMCSKKARDERISRACSYVCAGHHVCLAHHPQEVDYNIWIFSGVAPFTVPFSPSRALCEGRARPLPSQQPPIGGHHRQSSETALINSHGSETFVNAGLH